MSHLQKKVFPLLLKTPPLHLRPRLLRPFVLPRGWWVADYCSMADQINISEVIARMRSGADGGTFLLEFVVSQGKDKGLRKKRKCRYGAPVQEIHTPRAKREAADADHREHVENGTLPLTNLDAYPPRYFTPLISHMVGYNNILIRH